MTETVLALSLFNKIVMDHRKEKVKLIYQIQLLALGHTTGKQMVNDRA